MWDRQRAADDARARGEEPVESPQPGPAPGHPLPALGNAAVARLLAGGRSLPGGGPAVQLQAAATTARTAAPGTGTGTTRTATDTTAAAGTDTAATAAVDTDTAATAAVDTGTDSAATAATAGTAHTTTGSDPAHPTGAAAAGRQAGQDYDGFRRMVINATALRLEANRAALAEWAQYLNTQLSPEELRRQVIAEQERALIKRAAAGPRPGLQLEAIGRRAQSTSAAIRQVEQRVAENKIGGGCQYCHEIVGATNLEHRAPGLATPSASPLDTLRQGAAEESARPTLLPPLLPQRPGAGLGDASLSGFPNVQAEAAALGRIQPVLRQLGDEGFKVLPAGLIDSQLSDAQLRAEINTAIDQRRANYAEFIARTREPDFDYLMPRPILRELLPLASPEVQARVERDLAKADSDARAEAVLLGLATVAALLLTIFPPTALIGIALDVGLAGYGVVTGLEEYGQGRQLSLGIGSSVLDPQQQEAAHGLMAMGALNIVLSGVSLAAGTVQSVRLIRAGGGADAALEAVEAQAGDAHIRVSDLNTGAPRVTVTTPDGVIERGLDEVAAAAAGRATSSRQLVDDFLRHAEAHQGQDAEEVLWLLGLRSTDELYELAAGARSAQELETRLARLADQRGVTARAELAEHGRAVDAAPGRAAVPWHGQAALDLPEYQEAMAEARRALHSLPEARPKPGSGSKGTIARAEGSEPTESGWKDTPGYPGKQQTVTQTRVEGTDAGHESRPDFRDTRDPEGGPPHAEGSFEDSHAERQAAVRDPDRPLGVSSPMCPRCRSWFQRRAVDRQRPQFVADPNGVHVFLTDGRHLFVPH